MTSEAISTARNAMRTWGIALISALPCLFLSYVLFNVWREPMAWSNGGWVPFGVGILLLEFLIVHSGAFIAAIAVTRELTATRKLLFFGALLGFYGLMALGFALATDSPSLMAILAAVMIGRFVNAIGARPGDMPAIGSRIAFSIATYVIVVFATVLIAVPEWGVTREVLDAVYPDRGTGLWEQEPQRALAGGAVYFAMLGIAELTFLRAAQRDGQIAFIGKNRGRRN